MKKVIILSLSLLLAGVGYIAYNFLIEFPSKSTTGLGPDTNLLIEQSQGVINDSLRLCYKQDNEIFSKIFGLLHYSDWLDHYITHKSFINQRSELKEAIAKQLKEAINVLDSMADDNGNKFRKDTWVLIDFFNDCLGSVEFLKR